MEEIDLQQPQHPREPTIAAAQAAAAAAKPMTKLPGLTSSHGTTTLIHRSGHSYQLHRPHLALASQEQQQQQQQQQSGTTGPEQQAQQPPHKKLKAAGGSGAEGPLELTLSAKQQQQQQQALATNVLLRSHNPSLHAEPGGGGGGGGGHLGSSPNHAAAEGRTHQHSQQQQPHSQHPRHRHLHKHGLHGLQGLGQLGQQQPPPQPVSTHVSCLYPEILAQIFSNLDVRDRGRAAQVCVAWREAAYHRSAWRGVQARLHLRKHTSAVFQCLERRGIRRVQVLSVTMRRHSLGDVFRGIPKLQSLNLSGCYHMSDASLNSAIQQSYPSLTELDLSLCKNLTDLSLNKIGQHLPNLQTLQLGGCSNISNHGLQIIAWGLKNLRRLDLRSCWLISDQGIGHLAGLGPDAQAGCQQLEHLGLQDCQRVSDEGLRHLAQGLSSSLRSINLSFCVLITDSGMKHVARIAALRELDLRSCDNISEIGVAYLAEGGSRISSLDVSFCDKIGDQALQHISQGLFNLRSLSMAACPISDEGIAKIAKTQQELETLHIGQCSKLTDRSVFAILDNMHHLRQIDLYGCTKMSKHALDRLELKTPRISLNRDLWQERR